jgi:hypothetical protein
MGAAWITVAVLGGILFVIALSRVIGGLRPQPEMRGLPMTALELLGWVGVCVAGAIGAGLGVLVAIVGVTGFHEEPAARFTFWLMLLVGIGVWATTWMVLKRRGGAIVADERDRAILARSFSVESMIVLVSLVGWTVGLTEAFWDEGAVPIAYLQLLFWTTLIGGGLGRSLGIILGYRREITVDA